MSNANRDYAIVYDVKNSSLVLSRPLVFYITDQNTSNIFVRLVTKVDIGNGVDQYTDIEEASSYALTMRAIKPNNEVKSIEATQHELGSIFQFDLTEDFKDIPGKYICELIISTIVSERQELITSDPFNYEVKRSILSNVSEITETEDITTEKLLNNIEASKIRLFNDLELAKTNLHNDLNATKSELNSQVQANDNKIENIKEELSSRLDITGADLSSQIQASDNKIENVKEELSSQLGITKSELNSQVQANDNKIENVKEELSSQLGITKSELSLQIKDIKKNVVSICDFGGNVDVEDNRVAWMSAMEYLSSLGGGTLIIPSGVFNFTPGLPINTNCTVKGYGKSSVLRVKDNSGDFYMFINMSRNSNNSLLDCHIDLNRENNGGLIERNDGTFAPQIAVYFTNSHYSRVERCYIESCGIWTMTVETGDASPYSTYLTIRDNIINWYPQDTEKGNISVDMKYDNTMLYMDAENYVVENNTINCLLENNGMTGIELHQRLGRAYGNKINGFRNGILIVPMISKFNDKPCDMIATNNIINAKCMGICLWPFHTKKLDNISISNNRITMDSTKHTSSYGICTVPMIPDYKSKPIENVQIFGNTIEFVDDKRAFEDSDYLVNFCGIFLKNNDKMENITIKSNDITNAPGNGIFVGRGKEGFQANNIVIDNNRITNCCSNTNISNSVVKRAPIHIGSEVINSYIGTNTLINNLYNVDYIIANYSNINVSKQNIFIKNKISDNTIVNYDNRIGYDGGTGSIDYEVKKSLYYLDGDICTINVEFDITNISNELYGMHFMLPYQPYFENQIIDVLFSNCNVGKINACTIANNKSCYLRKSSSANMNALGSHDITNGAKIIVSGSYKIKDRYL